jgi:hypothetical protein
MDANKRRRKGLLCSKSCSKSCTQDVADFFPLENIKEKGGKTESVFQQDGQWITTRADTDHLPPFLTPPLLSFSSGGASEAAEGGGFFPDK